MLACLLLTASSAEARIESQEVSQSASSVVDYWTAERMESAKPAELQFGGTAEQAKAQAAPLPWTSEEVTTPYTQRADVHARQGVLHARRRATTCARAPRC